MSQGSRRTRRTGFSNKTQTIPMSVNGMVVRPCFLPRQQAKLARGANDKEHAMSQTPNTAIAVIGIDIGKNLVPRRGPRCARRHRAAAKVVAWPGRKRGSPIYCVA